MVCWPLVLTGWAIWFLVTLLLTFAGRAHPPHARRRGHAAGDRRHAQRRRRPDAGRRHPRTARRACGQRPATAERARDTSPRSCRCSPAAPPSAEMRRVAGDRYSVNVAICVFFRANYCATSCPEPVQQLVSRSVSGANSRRGQRDASCPRRSQTSGMRTRPDDGRTQNSDRGYRPSGCRGGDHGRLKHAATRSRRRYFQTEPEK